MKKIFVDCDVILDVLMKRTPHYIQASDLFSLIERKEIHGFTSPLVYANVYYILSQEKPKEDVMRYLQKLRLHLSILNLNEMILDMALLSDFKDFEDAIQYHVALESKMDCIVTRNIKDYKLSKLPVYSPFEYLSVHKALQ